MKRICLLFLMFISFSSVSSTIVGHTEEDTFIQSALSLEEYAKTITNRMVIELNLSPDQIKDVDTINLRFIQAEQILMEKMGKENEILDSAMKVLEDDRICALSLVLTSKQVKEYKKMLQQ